MKAGWKPRRTLVYANWDAEEYGLVGSTEWAEEHAEELDEKAVLLLNVDSAVSGPTLDIDGVPSMRNLVLDAARHVNDPLTGKSLEDDWNDRRRKAWASGGPLELDGSIWDIDGDLAPDRIAGPDVAFSPQMNYLGSGSDYTAFLDHLAIPAIDVNLTGRYGVYHSIYDDFYWMEHFGDPGFVLHATAAKLYTRIAMRAAGADVVPFRFTPYGDALREHVDELRRMVLRKTRAADKPPKVSLDRLPELISAVRAFREAAREVDAAVATLTDSQDAEPVDPENDDAINDDDLKALNDSLIQVERAFLATEGLPGRPWFKHSLYAPGLTLGYGSWPLPGLRQAIEEDDPAMFEAQMTVLVERIDAATEALKRARDCAGSGTSKTQ